MDKLWHMPQWGESWMIEMTSAAYNRKELRGKAKPVASAQLDPTSNHDGIIF